jgi:HEAT repeat protein
MSALGAILSALEDDESRVRREAVRAVGKLGPQGRQAFDRIARALVEDESGEVRSESGRVLELIGPPQDIDVPGAVVILTRALRHFDRDVRRAAIVLLSHLGRAAAPAVADILEVAQSDTDLRWWALTLLGALGQEARAAIALVIKGLADGDAAIRGRSAWVMGRIGLESPTILAVLIQALSDCDPEVRFFAAEALTILNPKMEAPARVLIETLSSKTMNVELRERAAEASTRREAHSEGGAT